MYIGKIKIKTQIMYADDLKIFLKISNVSNLLIREKKYSFHRIFYYSTKKS